ncbi:hypothetical protein HC744_06035 [Arthrobacter sp. S1_S22]|nr:hypothetical protein [Arthrobacter sp. S1_S22]
MMAEARNERQVLDELTEEEQHLLRRVLEIERSKMHLSTYDATDDLLTVVKEILP